MKIAILGAGHGGKAAAADMTLAGHEVHLFEFPQFDHNLDPIRSAGGIRLTGAGRTGFARLARVTSDIAEALAGVEMVLPVLPAFGHKPLALACSTHLKPGQTVILTPGSTLGSLEFIQALAHSGVSTDISIGEVHALPYATRGAGAEVGPSGTAVGGEGDTVARMSIDGPIQFVLTNATGEILGRLTRQDGIGLENSGEAGGTA